MAETSGASSSEVNYYNYNCSGTFSMQAGVIHNTKDKVSDIATLYCVKIIWWYHFRMDI